MTKISLDIHCILTRKLDQIHWSGEYSPEGSDDRWRVGVSYLRDSVSDKSTSIVIELCKRGDNLLDGVNAQCEVFFSQKGGQVGETKIIYNSLFIPMKYQCICDIPIDFSALMCIHSLTKPLQRIEIFENVKILPLEDSSILEPIIQIRASIRYSQDVSVMKGYVCSSSASLEDDIMSYTSSQAGLECADVELIGSDGSVYTHSFLLKSRSYILMTLIEYHTIDDHESVRIKFPTVPKEVLKDFVCFIERDTVNNLPENAMDLFVLADQYHLRRLKAICENYLANNVFAENAPQLKTLCDTIGSNEISKALFNFNSVNLAKPDSRLPLT